MSTMRAVRETLVELSRRHSRVDHEAEDLAHDILLSALRRGSPLESQAFLKSLRGAARRHGAFLARTAARRRAREARQAHEANALGGHSSLPGDASLASLASLAGLEDAEVEAAGGAAGAPLSALSPSLRTTLFLLFLGLEKAELRLALGVTDAALRKRFQALRDHGPLARPDLGPPRRTPALSRLRRNQVKLLPRLAAALVDGQRRLLAASDPDGHGLIFAEALTSGRRTATTDEPAPNARAPEKGTPC